MNDITTDAVSAASFRNRLLELDSHVDSDALQDIKFLLSDSLPTKVLLKADSARTIFEELEKKGLLSEGRIGLVGECVYLAGLAQYLHLLPLKKDEVERAPSNLTPFRKLMFIVASELTEEDVRKMAFQLGIAKAKLPSIKDGIGLLSYLEKSGFLAPHCVGVLLTGLQAIQRLDLKSQVLHYQQDHCRQGSGGEAPPPSTDPVFAAHPPVRPILGLPSSQPSADLEQPARVRRPVLETGYSPAQGPDWRLPKRTSTGQPAEAANQATSSDKKVWAAGNFYASGGVRGLERRREVMTQTMAPGCAPDKGDEYYPMSRKPRGICLVINNESFQATSTLKDRAGTQFDEEKLRRVFESLDFQIRVYRNATAESMQDALKKIAAVDHRRFDCFVCCILSHGSDEGIFGVDGQTVSVESLISPLFEESCPSLREKPKLFFFQACRGSVKQIGVPMEGEDLGDPEEPLKPGLQLLPEPDFLLGFCTPAGYSSFRSRTLGSWYMTRLVEQLEKHARSKDLLHILTIVNEELCKEECHMDGKFRKQVPAPVFSLRKKVLFS